MKAMITVDIIGMKSNLSEVEIYITLDREFDLPFIPFPEMKLIFDVIKSNDPNAEEHSRSITNSVLVTGIFEIIDVFYNIGSEQIEVRATECYETEPEARAAANQYITGYKFREF